MSPIVLNPNKAHAVIDQPSDYSSALLGVGQKGGWLVRARFHVTVDLKGGGQLKTADQGVPFDFDWVYPDEAGFAAMRDRLRKLLRDPEKKMAGAYLIGALLDVPEAAKAVSCADLLAAVAKREGGAEGRVAIARHLGKHHKGDPAVVAFYKDRLAAGDQHAVLDASSVWDTAYVEPMVRLYEDQGERHPAVLEILHHHRADWPADAKVASRLSAAFRKRHPIVDKKPGELTDKQLLTWATDLHYLAMTGDQTLVAALRPALDDRRAFRKGSDVLSATPMRPPTLRVCDCALDAILTLLDGGTDEAYRKAGVTFAFRRDKDEDAKAAAARDKMIDALKRRLADADKK